MTTQTEKKPIPALSIRQPWASLIVHAGKDIENRDWATSYRGPLLIHAAKKPMTEADYWAVADFLHERRLRINLTPTGLPYGQVIGVVDLVDCVQRSDSPWFVGKFGFVLANPRAIEPYGCRGQLGFFTPQQQPVAASLEVSRR